MYRDNTPTFRAGKRNLVNFAGFNPEEEEKELTNIKRSQIKKNDAGQSQEHRRKNRWNKITHKIDDLHPLDVEDSLDKLEESLDSNNEIITELKIARLAYQLSLEYDYCPSNGDKGYVSGIDEYSGSRPDEIASAVMNLIDQLKK